MIHGRTSSGPPNCIIGRIGRIATPLLERGITSSKMHAHTVGQSTCGCPGLSKCVQTLSLVGHQTLSVSQCVSLIKIGCMQRATPQPSEAEMGFDFHNPVSSVQLDPSTYMLTEQECSVKANRSILCHSANKH